MTDAERGYTTAQAMAAPDNLWDAVCLYEDGQIQAARDMVLDLEPVHDLVWRHEVALIELRWARERETARMHQRIEAARRGCMAARNVARALASGEVAGAERIHGQQGT